MEQADFQHSTDAILQQQICAIRNELQYELQRLKGHALDHSGNAALYNNLADQLKRVCEEVVNPDIIQALNNAIEHLHKAEHHTKANATNQVILEHLQETNASLFKARNIRA